MTAWNKIIGVCAAFAIAVGGFGVYAQENTDKMDEPAVNELSKTYAEAKEMEELFFSLTGRAMGGNTRGAFVNDIITILRYSAEKPSSPDFKDVDINRSDAAAIHSAVIAGFVSKSSDYFRPDEIITPMEAIKIAVSALGYGELAQYKGGWTRGYLSCARTAGLTKGINTDLAELGEKEAKILIFNMLCAKVVNASYGDNRREFEEGDETLLEMLYNIYSVSGIVTKTPENSLYTTGVTDEIVIAVGDKELRCDEEKYYYELIGYNVRAYYDEYNKLVSVHKTYDNCEITIEGEYASYDDSLTISYSGEKRRYTYKLSSDYSFIYNNTLSQKRLKDILGTSQGELRLLDNDDDGEYEICFFDEYKYMVVEKVSRINRAIYGRNTADGLLDLSDENGIYSIRSSEGEIWIGDIESNDTLAVLCSEDNKLISITVLENKISGKIERSYEDKIVINDIEYKTTPYFNKYYKNAARVGAEGDFILSKDGRIVSCDLIGEALNYGYITDVSEGEPLSDEIRIKMFLQSGEFAVFKIKNKVIADGKSAKTNDIYKRLTEGGRVRDQLVKYDADENNILKCIDFAEVYVEGDKAKNGKDSLTEYVFSTNSFYYKDGVELMYPSFNVSSTVVFVIPNDLKQEEIYRATGSSYFKDVTNYILKVYDVNEAGTAGAVVYRTDRIGADISEYAPSFVVEEVVEAINGDGELQNKVYGWSEKAYNSYFIDEEISIYKASGEKLGFGDVIRFYAEKGEIKSMICDFDANENVFDRNNVADAASMNVRNTEVYYQSGKIHSIKDGFVYMSAPGDENGNYDFSMKNLRNFPVKTDNIVIVDLERKTIRTGKLEDISTYLNSGGAADFALLRQRTLQTSAIIVYAD